MPKAYWIVSVSVHDPEHYPEYLGVALPVFEKFGANFIVRGDRHPGSEISRCDALSALGQPQYGLSQSPRQPKAKSGRPSQRNEEDT